MREIKFRQWMSRNKHWHYFGFEDGICTGVISASLSENPIMQFTGLKDKNNREIYEEDIVRILYTNWPSQTPDESGNYPMTLEEYKISRSVIGYVSWDDYSTGWVIKTKSKMSVNDEGTVMTSIIHGIHGEREVIGNIYQNSQLLK